jgi:integrase/recombinase XerD
MHSLRHSLASRLLRHDVPLTTIASILGHTSSESTRIYTKVDLPHLQACALDPEEVGHA